MDYINQLQKLASQAINQVQAAANNTANNLGEMVGGIQQTTAEITTASVNLATNWSDIPNTLASQGLQAVQNANQTLTAAATGATTSSLVVADALQNLPKTAAELALEMPKIAHRLKYRAGVRAEDLPRSDADMMKLFDKIPGTSKLEANEKTIREFLSDKHGSHIIPRSQGGSNGADNILWEVGVDNLRRGAEVMTVGEQLYIRVYNAVDSLVSNSATIARLGITATGTAILTQVTVTAISYSLDLYRGDITVEEYRHLIWETAKTAGIATPVVFLVLVAVLALFPEFTVILSAPVVVAGFNSLFGISLALPIIQSLLRHAQAGGFGSKAVEVHENIFGSSAPA